MSLEFRVASSLLVGGLDAAALLQAQKASPCRTCLRLQRQIRYPPVSRRQLSRTSIQSAEKQESRSQTPPPPLPPAPTARQLASAIQQASKSGFMRNVIEPYAAFGSTERLFKQCLRQADYTVPNAMKKPPEPAPKNEAEEDVGEGKGIWFASRDAGGLELPVTFGTWAQVMILHMYILIVRMRSWSDAQQLRAWEQQLLDHFSYAAEERMDRYHGMAARGVRNKHLKDLWLQYRGVILSYDEGLARGDAFLGAAIWRSIFKASENADVQDIALVVAYLRREVHRMETVPDTTVVTGGYDFGDLQSLRQTIERSESRSMRDADP